MFLWNPNCPASCLASKKLIIEAFACTAHVHVNVHANHYRIVHVHVYPDSYSLLVLPSILADLGACCERSMNAAPMRLLVVTDERTSEWNMELLIGRADHSG